MRLTITQIREKLDEYAEAEALARQLAQEEERAVQTIVPAEVQKAMQDVHAEFAPKLQAAAATIGALSAEIKAGVATLRKTVEGTTLAGKFQEGRTIWDGDALTKFAQRNPRVLRCKKETKPSVSIVPREKV